MHFDLERGGDGTGNKVPLDIDSAERFIGYLGEHVRGHVQMSCVSAGFVGDLYNIG